jgi:hypothetical protein
VAPISTSASQVPGNPTTSSSTQRIVFTVGGQKDADQTVNAQPRDLGHAPLDVQDREFYVQQPRGYSVLSVLLQGMVNGAAEATVTEQSTASGVTVNLSLSSVQSGDYRVRPTYVARAGSWSTGPQPVPMDPVNQLYIGPPGQRAGDFTAHLSLPPHPAAALSVTVNVNPWTQGGFSVTSRTSRGNFEFMATALDFTLP